MLIHANLLQGRQSDKGVHNPYFYIRISAKLRAQPKTDQKLADKIFIGTNLRVSIGLVPWVQNHDSPSDYE